MTDTERAELESRLSDLETRMHGKDQELIVLRDKVRTLGGHGDAIRVLQEQIRAIEPNYESRVQWEEQTGLPYLVCQHCDHRIGPGEAHLHTHDTHDEISEVAA